MNSFALPAEKKKKERKKKMKKKDQEGKKFGKVISWWGRKNSTFISAVRVQELFFSSRIEELQKISKRRRDGQPGPPPIGVDGYSSKIISFAAPLKIRCEAAGILYGKVLHFFARRFFVHCKHRDAQEFIDRSLAPKRITVCTGAGDEGDGEAGRWGRRWASLRKW